MDVRPGLVLGAMLTVFGLSLGCGDDATGPEAEACFDMADAVAEAAQRCGEDYEANRNSFIAVAADGDCANITHVRDRQALYDECIPSLQTIECSDLQEGNLDGSCRDQLWQ